ncbi:MAG: ArgE/DapE family deacylase [Candidatus Freyarchaeota archaeon]|nr:ArgE/DapE family deacylase [Candidatus Freyrarchaeum guaymaensis]
MNLKTIIGLGEAAMSDEYVFKVVVIGDGGVGKTSLIMRLTEDKFLSDYKPTLGTDFASHKLDIDDSIVTLQLWDLGGQPSFAHLRSFFYTGARGGVIVFDLTNVRSFENVEKWYRELVSVCGEVPIILVGNKHDLIDQRRVPKHEAEQVARKIGAIYFETSAKTRYMVNEAFTAIARLLLGVKEKQKVIAPLEVTPEVKKRLLDLIDESKEYAVDLLRDLISAQSVNPPGFERQAAEIVLGELYRIGAQTELHEKEENRTNVIGKLGEGSPKVILTAHLDVVPPGEGWIYPPFRATVKEGYVIGRGSVDAKGSLTSMLLALHAIKKLNIQLYGTVMLVATADEEMAGELGMKYLLRDLNLTADYAIVGGQTRSCKIGVAERGLLWIKATCRGKAAHGGTPFKGINAIQGLIKLLENLSKVEFDVPPHPLMGEVTMNIGTLRGGIGVNVVPDVAEATIDIRYTPHITKEEIINKLTEIAKKTEEGVKGIEINLEIILSEPPTEVPADHPLVQTIRKNIKEVVGEEPELIGGKESTSAKICILHGIPAVFFGPGEEEQRHEANEKVPIDELITAAKIYALTILDLLSLPNNKKQNQKEERHPST